MQGSVLAPLKCSVLTDTVGKYCYIYKKALYIYKNSVHIPPIWMVDDCLAFSSCGLDTIINNELINTKMSMKKLRLNEDICYQMKVGKNTNGCC